jgi:hypothetical protein
MGSEGNDTAVGDAVDAPPAPPGRRGAKARPAQRSWTDRLLVTCFVLILVEGALISVSLQRTSQPGPADAIGTTLPPAASNIDLGRSVDPTTLIPDPDVVTSTGIDYLYAGEANFTPPHIPVRTFRVLGTWLQTVDAMPALPAWAGAWVWNPDVRYEGGRYVMWFTAFTNSHRLPITGIRPRCLGWAVSKSPLGPFVPSATPAVCQLNLYGAIDPRTFVAPGGQEWLYWKSDGNAVLADPLPTTIWAQRLAPDGTTLEGQPVAIMTNSQSWEGRVVESPQMEYANGHYYLFFSGNVSGSTLNGIGMAPCKGPAGPCRNTSNGPWLSSSPQNEAVGEESLYTQGATTWLMYSPRGFGQTLSIARVAFGPTGPYIAAFSHLPSVG